VSFLVTLQNQNSKAEMNSMGQTVANLTRPPAATSARVRFSRLVDLVRPASLKWQICLTILTLLFCSAFLIQIWNYKNFLSGEVQRTEEKHLVIAQNLSLAMSRYINDVAQVFIYLQADLAQDDMVTRSHVMMRKFDLDTITIVRADNSIAQTTSAFGKVPPLPSAAVLDELREGGSTALFGVQVSDLERIGDKRYFVLGLKLQDGALAIGYLTTDYIKSLQERILFGDNGHSAIFDATGRAIAHPSRTVEDNMMDASGISVVALMLERKEGVGMFYSPPMDQDMIAGYTYVPETGWAVMVPQPLSELSEAVHASLVESYLVALLTAVILAFMGWRLAHRIVQPIEHFTRSSQEITQGNYNVELPDLEQSSREMSTLNESLKKMVATVRQSEHRLRAALRLEEQESQRKNEFIVIASHELRTPLNGVLGMLSACSDRSQDEEMRGYLDLAHGSAKRLSRIVDNMIAFTEASEDELKISPAPFDARSSLEMLCRGFARRAEAKGLTFDFSWPRGEDRLLVADRDKIEQVVSILLDNAVKFTDRGGVLFSAQTETATDGTGSTLVISIRDTGAGMAEADQAQIFKPFSHLVGSQASNPFARHHQGIGMGLCIAKTVATAMGGSLSFTSQLNQGSTFVARIPVETSIPQGSRNNA
jgi:signal transduction histidine kinase